jgi:hypothetical protein
MELVSDVVSFLLFAVLLLALLLLATVASAGCPCPATAAGAHAVGDQEVLQVRVEAEGVEEASASGSGRTRVYRHVTVMSVYSGSCPAGPEIELRQVLDAGCGAHATLRRGTVYVVAGAYSGPGVRFHARPRAGAVVAPRVLVAAAPDRSADGRRILYLDPCAVARDPAAVAAGGPLLAAALRPKTDCMLLKLSRVVAGSTVPLDRTAWAASEAALAAWMVEYRKRQTEVTPWVGKEPAATREDLYVLGLRDGPMSSVDPLEGREKRCFFKSERPILDKEVQVCIEAQIGDRACYKKYIAPRTELARAYRSALSYMLARLAGSSVVAPNWPLFTSTAEGRPLLVGHCMETVPADFKQGTEARSVKVLAVELRGMFKKKYVAPDTGATVAVDPTSDLVVPMAGKVSAVFRNAQSASLLPCKAVRAALRRSAEGLPEEFEVKKSGVFLGRDFNVAVAVEGVGDFTRKGEQFGVEHLCLSNNHCSGSLCCHSSLFLLTLSRLRRTQITPRS